MYHKLFFILLALLIAQAGVSQSQRTELCFCFDSTDLDKPLITKRYLVVDGHVLKVARADTQQKKQTEFIRLDSNTYYFTETDSTGTLLAEGKALLDKKPFIKYKAPIYDSMGNVKGFQNVAIMKFAKTGFWIERIADNLARHGSYMANKKEGKWVYAADNVWGMIQKSELYHAGELVAGESMNLLETNPASIPAIIVGQWGIPRESLSTNNTSVHFQRIKNSGTSPYAGHFTFEANGNCQLKIKGHHNVATHKGSWKIDGINKVVTVSIPKLGAIILINYVSTDTLSGFFQNTQ